MTRVSRISLPRSVQDDLITQFWFGLGKLDRNATEIFLKDLLSPTEVIMLAKRLEILKLLRKKFKYENVKKAVQVTEPTIAKMSSVLQRANQEFKTILDRMIEDETIRWKNERNSRKPRWKGKMVNYVPR